MSHNYIRRTCRCRSQDESNDLLGKAALNRDFGFHSLPRELPQATVLSRVVGGGQNSGTSLVWKISQKGGELRMWWINVCEFALPFLDCRKQASLYFLVIPMIVLSHVTSKEAQIGRIFICYRHIVITRNH